MQADRAIYLSVSELARRYREADGKRCGQLTEFELRCFSQHGEDGVIAEILARIGLHSSYFVEFGIESGREGNCVFLADVLGWQGLFIESDETCYASLARKYQSSDQITAVNVRVSSENIEALLAARPSAAGTRRPLDRRRRAGLLDLGCRGDLPAANRGD